MRSRAAVVWRAGGRQRRHTLLEGGGVGLRVAEFGVQVGIVEDVVVEGAVEPELDDEVADIGVAAARRRENDGIAAREHLGILLIEADVFAERRCQCSGR